MQRIVLTLLTLTLAASIGGSWDDPAADYLAARERLSPAPASSRISLTQVLSTGDFPHIELVGDVCGKAFAVPTLPDQPKRTLMLTLDDGFNVALRADEGIDPLQVGQRVSVIAGVPRGGASPHDLIVEKWIYQWDLPRDVEPREEDAAAAPAPPQMPAEAPPAAPQAPQAPEAPRQLPPPAASASVQVDTVDVWTNWVLELNSKLSEQQARDIVRWVLHYSQEYDVNHKLIFALIKWESWYNPGCVSHAGAIGLMQLMPGTARGLGVNPRNVQQNIQGGTRYLAEQLGTYRDRPNYERVILALACYNAGPNAVKRAGHRVPNITETRRYVKKVSDTFYELHTAGMP